MRILAFYPYIPYPPNRGAYYRGFHLLKALAREHDVDFVALADKCEGIELQPVFQEFCRRVEFIPFEHPHWQKLFPQRLLNPLPSTIAHWRVPIVQRALDDLLAANSYDAIHIFDIVLGQYFFNGNRRWPLVADRTRVDLQYQWEEQKHMRFGFRARMLNAENLLKLWRYERAIADRAVVEIVCGPDDETFLRRFVRRRMRIEVIPNGVDLEYFHPAASGEIEPDAAPTILFCGAMDYNPNIDALRWYFGTMHEPLRRQIPDLRTLIVGKDPVPEVQAYGRLPGVTVTGGVPDVRPFYQRAWLQIVPLRIGCGTRLKIVESLAMGTPVISTTIGAQGLGLKHERDILLADTSAEFVAQTVRALRDPTLRGRLEQNGLQTVRATLSWPSLGRQLCDVYRHCFMSAPQTKRKVQLATSVARR